jgi:hypothetical protein
MTESACSTILTHTVPRPDAPGTPSPLVRISPDVIFSREVLCHAVGDEPYSLSGSTLRRAPRSTRNAVRESTARLNAARAKQPPPLLNAAGARCNARTRHPQILSTFTHAFLPRATTVKLQGDDCAVQPVPPHRCGPQYKGVKENEDTHLRTAACRRVSLRAC